MEVLAIAIIVFYVGWIVYAAYFFLNLKYRPKPKWKGGSKEVQELQEKSLLL